MMRRLRLKAHGRQVPSFHCPLTSTVHRPLMSTVHRPLMSTNVHRPLKRLTQSQSARPRSGQEQRISMGDRLRTQGMALAALARACGQPPARRFMLALPGISWVDSLNAQGNRMTVCSRHRRHEVKLRAMEEDGVSEGLFVFESAGCSLD